MEEAESAEWRLLKMREREHVIRAIERAQADWREILEVVQDAEDWHDALARLSDRFGFTPAQATAVVDVQFRRLTHSDRQRIRNELAALEREIADLEGST